MNVRTENIVPMIKRLNTAPSWFPRFVDANMNQLGRRIAYLMRRQVKEHRYTGALEESIVSSNEGQRVVVGPTAKRGKWDAGLLLERGTGPIPGLPFEPIRKWAEFRGLPAGPVWYKLKTEGANPHPFVEGTLQRGDTRVALQNTAKRLGFQLAAYGLNILSEGAIPTGETQTFGGGG